MRLIFHLCTELVARILTDAHLNYGPKSKFKMAAVLILDFREKKMITTEQWVALGCLFSTIIPNLMQKF